jgi:hypothetical protein
MRRIVVLFALAGIAACGGDATSPSVPRAVEGTYHLASVNGQAMPLLLAKNDTATLELLDGSVALGTDGTFLDIIRLRRTQGGGPVIESDTISGTFLHVGSTLLFQPGDQSGNYFMTVTDEQTLTETDPGVVIVYRR